eukprot:m51a1_g9073 putative poly (1092) ;mRNA; r:138588-142601
MGKHSTGDVSAEYAASGRAKCKKCWKEMPAGGLRLGVWEQSPAFDGLVVRWYHAPCYFRKFGEGSAQRVASSRRVMGFSELRWDDQLALRRELGEANDAPPEEEAACRLRWRLRDAIEDAGIAVARAMLAHNGQPITGGAKHIVQRCVEGMLYGALTECPACKHPELYWDPDLRRYKCSGDASEWARCTYENADFWGVPRNPWKNLGNTGVALLDEWVQPAERIPLPTAGYVAAEGEDGEDGEQTEQQTTAACSADLHLVDTTKQPVVGAAMLSQPKPAEPAEPAAAAAQSEQKSDTPFAGMKVAVSGKFSVSQASIKELIEKGGGSVATAVTKSLGFFVSTRADWTKPSVKAKAAASHGIAPVTEEFLRDCLAAGKLLDMGPYHPTEPTAAPDRPAGDKNYSASRTNAPSVDCSVSLGSSEVVKPAVVPARLPAALQASPPAFAREVEGFVNPGGFFTASPFMWSEQLRVVHGPETNPHPVGDDYYPARNVVYSPAYDINISLLSNVLENVGSKMMFLNPSVTSTGEAEVFVASNTQAAIAPPEAVEEFQLSVATERAKVSMRPVKAPFIPVPKPQPKSGTAAKSVPINKKAVNPDTGLAATHHVMQNVSDGTLFNAVLSNSDISAGFNSYYYMQILRPDSGQFDFIVWMKWGRVGTSIGKDKKEYFHSPKEAISFFCDKFFEKTQNNWSDRANFQKRPRSYYPVDVDYGDAEALGDESVASELDLRVYELVNQLFDADKMRREMASLGIDTQKMPLGKLTSRHILSGFEALRMIEPLLTSCSVANKDVLLLDYSNRFYTLIPHVVEAGKGLPIINTREVFMAKMGMLEALVDIEVAASLLREGQSGGPINPTDLKYKKLRAGMEPVPAGSPEWKVIEQYARNTTSPSCGFSIRVSSVFRVQREGEEERFSAHKADQNRVLLWHGSRTTNYVGIVSQGLRIAPPEAPVSGYMFGKGVYFADMASKSAEYTHATPSNPKGVLLLCEVALGSMLELSHAQYVEPKELDAIGKQSTKGMGRFEPDRSKDVDVLEDGVIVPLGNECRTAIRDCELANNEYIVYDVSRVKIRYLLNVELAFEAGWKPRDLTYSYK